MGRRRGRQSDRIAQSEEAKRLLREDTPEAVKIALRLALRGGRQERRRCLACGKPGIHCKVWSPPEAWHVESQYHGTGIRVYWFCQACQVQYGETGLPPELERMLQR